MATLSKSDQPRQTHYVALVLAPLVIVVLACVYTIVLAVRSDNAELPVDLIKTGKALDHTPAQKAALETFVDATALIDRSSGRVLLRLPGPVTTQADLAATLVHPTLSLRDVDLALEPHPEGMMGFIPYAIPLRGRLLVQSRSGAWVIETQYQLDAEGRAVVRFDGS